MKKLNIETFIQKASLVHNDLYDYTNSIYKNIRSKIKIICKTHGEFEQIADCHLQGKGCPECGINNFHKPIMGTKKFIELANIKHNNFYIYSKTNYIKNNIKVIIICPIHGDFEQAPYMHLNKNGCSQCAKSNNMGFSKERFIKYCNNKYIQNPVLYIIKCFNENEEFYKIGITSKSIKQRFHGKKMPYNYKIIYEQSGSPEVIYNLEKELHKKHKQFHYKPIIFFPGSAKECFSCFIE